MSTYNHRQGYGNHQPDEQTRGGFFYFFSLNTKIFVDSYEDLRLYCKPVEIAKGVEAVIEQILPRPTDAELIILRALWRLGPSTVRQVKEELDQDREAGYTTVLKLLQIMTEKGLVERDESQRTHVYQAKLTQEQTQQQLVDDLLQRAFSGSASQLVLRALEGKKTSAKEMAEIKELMERLDGGDQ